MPLTQRIEHRLDQAQEGTAQLRNADVSSSVLAAIELGITDGKSPMMDIPSKITTTKARQKIMTNEAKLSLEHKDIQRWIKINRVKSQMKKFYPNIQNINLIEPLVGPQLTHTNYYYEIQLAFTDIHKTGNKLGSSIEHGFDSQELDEASYFRKRGNKLLSHLAYDLEKIGGEHFKKLALIPEDVTFNHMIDTHTKEELLVLVKKFVTYLESGEPLIQDENQTDRVIRLTHPNVYGKILVFRNEKQISPTGALTHEKKATFYDHDLAYIRAQGYIEKQTKDRSTHINTFRQAVQTLKMRMQTQKYVPKTQDIEQLCAVVGKSKDAHLVGAIQSLLNIPDPQQSNDIHIQKAEQQLEHKLNEFDYIANTIAEQASSSLRQFTKDHLRWKFTVTELHHLLTTRPDAAAEIQTHLQYFLQAMQGQHSLPFSTFAQQIQTLIDKDTDNSATTYTSLGRLIQAQGMVYRSYLREHDIKTGTRSPQDLPLDHVREKIENAGPEHMSLYQFKPYVESIHLLTQQSSLGDNEKRALITQVCKEIRKVQYIDMV